MQVRGFKKAKRSESEVLSVCCQYLQAKKVFFWRQNTSGIHRTDPQGRQFWTRPAYSMRGVPDIIALKPGRIFGIEVKSSKGRLSPEQIAFKSKWEEFGGVYLLARGIDDLSMAGL